MKSPSATDQHAVEWEALVGKAILRFGDIELVSIKCLSLIPSDKISDTASRLDFSRRAELIVEVLEARPERSSEMSALMNGFKRAKELAQLRNLIAHNPVMLELYVNEDESQSFTRHAISSARTGKQSLDLEGLKESLKKWNSSRLSSGWLFSIWRRVRASVANATSQAMRPNNTLNTDHQQASACWSAPQPA